MLSFEIAACSPLGGVYRARELLFEGAGVPFIAASKGKGVPAIGEGEIKGDMGLSSDVPVPWASLPLSIWCMVSEPIEFRARRCLGRAASHSDSASEWFSDGVEVSSGSINMSGARSRGRSNLSASLGSLKTGIDAELV